MSSVATYTVHEPPVPDPDRVDRAGELVFVKDAFSWVTAILPPLGFAMRGLWLAALAYVVLASALLGALSLIGLDDSISSILIVALNVYLGFEAATVERLMLDRAGWRMLGSVSGKSLEECERRFFETWMPDQPMVAVNKPQAPLSTPTGPWRFGSKA